MQPHFRTPLALSIAVLACTQPQNPPDSSADESASSITGVVTVTPDRTAYAPGADVSLRIENKSDMLLGYNACTRRVEKESGSEWIEIAEPDRVCTMELRLLAARATVTETTELPSSLASGRYRLVLSLSPEPSAGEPPGERREPVLAASTVFRVE
jgi:hypothetical protein